MSSGLSTQKLTELCILLKMNRIEAKTKASISQNYDVYQFVISSPYQKHNNSTSNAARKLSF